MAVVTLIPTLARVAVNTLLGERPHSEVKSTRWSSRGPGCVSV
uniref:Succinate dehydrogenase complex assembly factor 2 n=1 Tax=Mus musculus TaxID=10090 RepID=A0A494BB88_MOUSE